MFVNAAPKLVVTPMRPSRPLAGWPESERELAHSAIPVSDLVSRGAARDELVEASLAHLRREFSAELAVFSTSTCKGRAEAIADGVVVGEFGPVLAAQLLSVDSTASVALFRTFDAPAFSEDDRSRFLKIAASLGGSVDDLAPGELVRNEARDADRRRVAEDLHDSAVQEIFAAGLILARALEAARDQQVCDDIQSAVDALDRANKAIRLAVFDLKPSVDDVAPPLSRKIESLVAQAARSLDFTPSVLVDVAADEAIRGDIEHNLLMVLKESLSNVAHHSGATKVAIEVSVGAGQLTAVVRDNGIGIGDAAMGGGLLNMRRRAARFNGSCVVGSPPAGGTLMRWRVPIAAS